MSELVHNVVKSGKFKVTTETPSSSTYIVAVPTPHIEKKCDLTYVLSACKNIAEKCQDNALIIIESTIKPNTCLNHVKPIFDKLGKSVHIVHCPERAIPGNTLFELINNDRIIGGLTKEATEAAYSIYESFCLGKMFKTTAINAECAKLMENTFRDVNIALANELSIIAEDIGFNVQESIMLANRHPRVNILQPGPGVGGHCIPIDPWFLTEDTSKAKLITTARNVNDEKPAFAVHKVLESSPVKNPKVAILGVAYKPDVDDARETPCKQICDELARLNIEFQVSDPFVEKWDHELVDQEKAIEWCDIVMVVTRHSLYRDLKIEKPFFIA